MRNAVNESLVADSLPSFAKNLHILGVDYEPLSLKHLTSLTLLILLVDHEPLGKDSDFYLF